MSANLIKRSEFERLFAAEDPEAAEARFSSAQAQIRRLEEELAALEESSRKEIARARQEAKEDTRREVEEELGRATAALVAAGAELHRLAAAQLTVVEEEIVDLALAVGAKILRREIARDDDYLPRLVRRCLKKLVTRASVTIRLNPQDHPRLAPVRDALVAETGGAHEITLVADRRVAPGGCVVETPDFIVDGTVPSQLETAGKVLRRDGP